MSTLGTSKSRFLQWAGLLNSTAQGTFFSVIFVFFAPILEAIREHPIFKPLLFPLAMITDVFAAFISGIDLFSSRNQNAGRTIQFVFDTIKAAIVVVAVMGSFMAPILFALLTPILFTIALGGNTLYNFALCLWSTFHWWRAGDAASKERHKADARQYLSNTLVGAITVAAVVTLLVSPVGFVIQMAMSIGSGILIGLSTIYGVILGVRNLRQKDDEIELQDFSQKDEHQLGMSVQDPEEELLILDSSHKKDNSFSLFNYYYTKNRSVKVLSLYQAYEDKQVAANGAKKYLLGEIKNKKTALKSQLEGTNWLDLWQHEKRQAKIDQLNVYKNILSSDSVAIQQSTFNDQCANVDFQDRLQNHVNQSFWKDTGDVEDISEALETYINKFASNKI